MNNEHSSLHDISLQLENVTMSLDMLIFLLDQYGAHKTDKISAAGICRILELINDRLKSTSENLSIQI